MTKVARLKERQRRLESRVDALENKFFAFQCGAQAQMERDRKAWELEEALKSKKAAKR